MSKEAGEVMRSEVVWCGVGNIASFETDGVLLSVEVALNL
jgi:hypothetical protein